MITLPKDTALETELQELYIIARNWTNDLDFITEELDFFKEMKPKYTTDEESFQHITGDLEAHLIELRIAVPEFLQVLALYVNDAGRSMDLSFLERYNQLQNDIQAEFEKIRIIKHMPFAQVIKHANVA